MRVDHVSDRAGLLVERAAAADADVLRDGDLHVVDVRAVPDRLEQPVREPEREDVLHGLLAHVVVDPEDLLLVEHPWMIALQLPRGLEVAPERLLEHDLGPAASPVLAEAVDDVRIHARGVASRRTGRRLPDPLVERVEVLDEMIHRALVGELPGHVAEMLRELVPFFPDGSCLPNSSIASCANCR
jgi:hypothetical protein